MQRAALNLDAMAALLARRMGLPEEEVAHVARVALLRDVGKTVVDDGILDKPGPLDAAEWELVRRAPVVGERLVASTRGLAHLAPAVRAAHERWDGGATPTGSRARAYPSRAGSRPCAAPSRR